MKPGVQFDGIQLLSMRSLSHTPVIGVVATSITLSSHSVFSLRRCTRIRDSFVECDWVRSMIVLTDSLCLWLCGFNLGDHRCSVLRIE